MQANKPYITTKLSNNLDEILFQIGALHTYSMIHNKTMCISDPDEFTEATKLFQYVPNVPNVPNVPYVPDDYYILSDADEQVFKIVPYAKNIILRGIFKSFKLYTEDTLSFIREYIYSNEDYMYTAYTKYNEIKQKFGCENNDEILSIYFNDSANKPSNTSYYNKAMILMNKKNVVVFSPTPDPDVMRIFDDDYNVQVIWDTDPYVRFILLSFFRYNVVQYYDSYFSMLAAYVSKYEEYKTVVVPDYLKKITNEKINNMNVVYLD